MIKIWKNSLFQIPVVILGCSLLGLGIASVLPSACSNIWRYPFIGLALASFIWMLVLPFNELLQKFLKLNMSLAGRISIFHAIAWSTLITVVVANNLPNIIESCQIERERISSEVIPAEIPETILEPTSEVEAPIEQESLQEELPEPEEEAEEAVPEPIVEEEVPEPPEPLTVEEEPEEEEAPVPIPVEEEKQGSKVEVIEPLEPAPLEEELFTIAELETLNLDWRPWKANVWNGLFYGQAHPVQPMGTKATFRFKVDKDGNISEISVSADLDVMKEYVYEQINRIERTDILTFPDSSERSTVIYQEALILCRPEVPGCGDPSVPENYEPDDETILIEAE